MDKLIINGPSKLKGAVKISGAKNACLPILTATLLNPNPVHLQNIPELADVKTMFQLLSKLGGQIEPLKKGEYLISTPSIKSNKATYNLVKTMRASILVLGPLLARHKSAIVSLPGGCAIGTRPIDIHLEGLKKLGAQINIQSGYVEAYASELKGAEIIFPFPSVGATENLMMTAVLAKGTTVLKNAAREPEITDLGEFLQAQGATISGLGSSTITIEGMITPLQETKYKIISDRIEAATYIIAALMTNSHIVVENMSPSHLEFVLEAFEKMGAKFKIDHANHSITVLKHKGLSGIHVDTAPYPGFPTDLQAQLMSLGLTAKSPTTINEKIFENRFMHVPELRRMGADITLNQNTATINQTSKLTGAPVMCTDLRASASLILASLVAQGKTEIQRIYHLDRGYEKIDRKLRKLGVKIKRVTA